MQIAVDFYGDGRFKLKSGVPEYLEDSVLNQGFYIEQNRIYI